MTPFPDSGPATPAHCPPTPRPAPKPRLPKQAPGQTQSSLPTPVFFLHPDTPPVFSRLTDQDSLLLVLQTIASATPSTQSLGCPAVFRRPFNQTTFLPRADDRGTSKRSREAPSKCPSGVVRPLVGQPLESWTGSACGCWGCLVFLFFWVVKTTSFWKGFGLVHTLEMCFYDLKNHLCLFESPGYLPCSCPPKCLSDLPPFSGSLDYYPRHENATSFWF